MQDYFIPLILICIFLISPIWIICLILRYTSKNPKHRIRFQLKIPGCSFNLFMSDWDDDEKQDVDRQIKRNLKHG